MATQLVRAIMLLSLAGCAAGRQRKVKKHASPALVQSMMDKGHGLFGAPRRGRLCYSRLPSTVIRRPVGIHYINQSVV